MGENAEGKSYVNPLYYKKEKRMINVEIEVINSSHRNVRTKTVEGETIKLPTIGQTFDMTAEPFNPNADYRFIRTSPVKKIKEIDEHSMHFWTHNSMYKLTVKGEKGEN